MVWYGMVMSIRLSTTSRPCCLTIVLDIIVNLICYKVQIFETQITQMLSKFLNHTIYCKMTDSFIKNTILQYILYYHFITWTN